MKGLDHASGHYNSQAGMVKSSWQRVGDQVRLNVTVPTNATATVIAGGKTMHVGAGNHTFTF